MRNHTLSAQIISLLACLGVTFVAAGIGAIATANAGSFYMQLVQPAWAPPPGVFGPVWTALYCMIGIAAWLVWRVDGQRRARRIALVVFLVQLALNSLWSWLFFGWHRGALAFAEILLLWLVIVANLVVFYRVRALAGWLLAPYLLWVTFAAALNYAMWQLNPGILG